MIYTTNGDLFVVRTLSGETFVSHTSGFMRNYLGKENTYYELSMECCEACLKKLDGGDMINALLAKEETAKKMTDIIYVGYACKPGWLLHLVAASKMEELVQNMMAAATDGYEPSTVYAVDTIAGKVVVCGHKEVVAGIIIYKKEKGGT